MLAFLSGFLAALAIGGALVLGFFLGTRRRTKPNASPGKNEENRLREDQKAFEDLLHYNREVAYGVNTLGGGDDL